MLDPTTLNLDDIADALADQTDYGHRWFINMITGEVVLWSSDTGIDGCLPTEFEDVEEGEPNLRGIDPLPSRIWYRDMAEFAGQTSDERARRRLARAIQGRGAFRRFRDELHQEFPQLLTVWEAFRHNRARCRAVEWLRDNALIEEGFAHEYLLAHPDPELR